MEKLVLDTHEKPASVLQWIFLSLQHVFAMFGATVLVPMLTGLPISVALVASGLGTLTYIGITRGKVPVYIGSSFAYIAAISHFAASGYHAAYTGLIIVGIIYVLVALIIKLVGKAWLDKVLPPVVVGPMIAVIGLSLAPVAIGNAGLSDIYGLNANWHNPLIAAVTFAITVLVALLGKGFFRIIPFLFGITGGYITALILGEVDTSVFTGEIFMLPEFKFIFKDWHLDFSGFFIFFPLAFVTIAEHIGDHTVLGNITGKNYIQEPGLDKTLMGDGVATMVSSCIGGPANTTYGENTGVVAMTKVASVWVIGTAAIIAILLGFIAPVNQFISSIPAPVMGGISIILFGLIAANGLKVLASAGVDMNNMKNIIIVATMLVIGLGGAQIVITEFVKIEKMALAAFVGIVLNLIIRPENTTKES